jgi:hypothetical protein
MSDFATARCLPWLSHRDDIRVVGAPEPVAPGVDLLRARVRPPWAVRFKFAGFLSLVAALLVMMGAARPAQADARAKPTSAAVRGVELGLGGLGLGAFAVGRRLDRSAPGVSILCLGAGADRRDPGLDTLTRAARARMSAESWPEGPVWMIAEGEPTAAARAQARELGVRVFFTDGAGRVREA